MNNVALLEKIKNVRKETKTEELEDTKIHLNDIHHYINIKEEEITIDEFHLDQDNITQICEPLKCGVCNNIFTNELQLEEHKKIHTIGTVIKQFLCTTCDTVFSVQTPFKDHFKFTCKLCDFETCEESRLNRHLTTHGSEKLYLEEITNGNIIKQYLCATCDGVFSVKTPLKDHFKFTCKLCDFETCKESKFNNHLATHSSVKPLNYKIHTGEKPGECNLKTHTKEKAFECQICKVRYSCNASLENHALIHTNKTIHTGEKRYKCKICEKKCTGEEHYIIHLLKHRGKKLFECKICGKEYLRRTVLDDHLQTHGSEKPYKCDACGSGYSYLPSLRRHMKIHIDEKPFQGKICD